MKKIIFETKYVANLVLDNLNNLNLVFPSLEFSTYEDLPILREIKISDFQNLLEEQKSRLEQEQDNIIFPINSVNITLNKSRFPVFSKDASPKYINKVAAKILKKIIKSKNMEIFRRSNGVQYLYDKKIMMGASYYKDDGFRGFFEYIFGEYDSNLKILSSDDDALDNTFLEVYLKGKFFALIHDKYKNITIEFPNAKYLNEQEQDTVRNISFENLTIILNIAQIYFSKT